MVKCINCDYCKITVNFADSYAEARCEYTEKARRKILASAYTTYRFTKKSFFIKDINNSVRIELR